MTVFSYQGIDATGQNETGTVDTHSEVLAYQTLKARGIIVFELTLGTEVKPELPWFRRDIRFSSQLSFEDQATTADLLAILFAANLSASEVLRILTLSSDKPEIRRHFQRVEQLVADGTSLADAFEIENKIFSPIFVSFLKISDTANTLPELLKSLARFFNRQNAIQQKVISALIYPIILIAAAIALLLVVILYLAPNLGPIFTSVGKDPPGTINALLTMNNFLRDNWMWVLVGSAGLIIGALSALQILSVRQRIGSLAFRIPVVGSLLRLSALSQLSQATELLLNSGQPLSTALKTAGRIMGANKPFSSLFSEAAEAIDSGKSASSVFETAKDLPATFKELFRIGEETNRLPSILKALSKAMSDLVDRQSQRLLNLLTPMLTLVLGIGIGFLIYTLMGAILEVNELAF